MPEITTGDEFGIAILRTLRACKANSVIEVGSWDGTGSTAVIIEALSASDAPRLLCLEANKDRFESLRQNVSGVPWVETVCMRSVSRNLMTPRTFDDVWRSPHNRLTYPRETVESWWNEQYDGPGYLDSNREHWDAALIDGCEFCGWDDYQRLRDQVRVLMLDDVFWAYKCAAAHDDLRGRREWECIWCSAYVRNGASIWVRS